MYGQGLPDTQSCKVLDKIWYPHDILSLDMETELIHVDLIFHSVLALRDMLWPSPENI